MIEITCDLSQMAILIDILDDSGVCFMDCNCPKSYSCIECLSKNIKWNIID